MDRKSNEGSTDFLPETGDVFLYMYVIKMIITYAW